jgi:hypothetical protein
MQNDQSHGEIFDDIWDPPPEIEVEILCAGGSEKNDPFFLTFFFKEEN